MTLIKSISGIRGTIGGQPGNNLTPIDIVNFASAYGQMLKSNFPNEEIKVVIGRDARISGQMVSSLVAATLSAIGVHVVDLQLSTTPTVEIAVVAENAHGGIILTASHNPEQWNALKLLNNKGEFISAQEGEKLIQLAEKQDFSYADVRSLGTYVTNETYLEKHIEMVVNYPLVDKQAIRDANFKIAVDGVNSSGGVFVPALLKALGVSQIEKIYCDPTGEFPHNPEPLPEHLEELSNLVVDKRCDLGIVVDPDVDRLAFVCENGDVFGEEYTLVAVADYVLSQRKGSAVSNLSSTRALRDVTHKRGGEYFASAVGEVNVVAKMKKVNAVIGGEGNGGIIVPDFHYGRDALIGIGLFLTKLAKSKLSMLELRNSYPAYFISKNKIELTPQIDVDVVLDKIANTYKSESIDRIDGVKIDFTDSWVHLRKSNTEPIIRIYAEHTTETEANQLANRIINDIKLVIA